MLGVFNSIRTWQTFFTDSFSESWASSCCRASTTFARSICSFWYSWDSSCSLLSRDMLRMSWRMPDYRAGASNIATLPFADNGTGCPQQLTWTKMDQPQFLFQQFASRRSVVYGTKGIVSSSQPLATQVGLGILDKGGNAGKWSTSWCCAIWCNAHFSTSWCCSSGICGSKCNRTLLLWDRRVRILWSRKFWVWHKDRDAFCLFYNANTKVIKALNGSGRAPAKLTIEHLRSRGIQGHIPATDLNSVTVPGSCRFNREFLWGHWWCMA